VNLKLNPRIEELKELLLRFDDNECNHNLWVSYGGNVISKVPDAEAKIEWEVKHKGIARFYYSFVKGYCCIGKRAAYDNNYMESLFSDLKKNWDRGSNGHVTYLRLIK